MARSGMKPVYIGDVGVINSPAAYEPIPKDLDISKLSFREMCNLAIQVGIDVRDVIGIKTCNEHEKMIFLGDKELPEGMNLFEHCNYCRNCWRLFRQKRL